ncbi:UDP-glucose 6-dehydrogenase [Diaporthe helianthi]|uniref:UDP-glucose 6-dehydrogenase n=1 Tax=Diaporthe helianthi TaxID=158607 RepID=A0A2P5HID5_DIAHE|nr:UDP-glucose 6-dehydrogenase [Diaporthe helianthi]
MNPSSPRADSPAACEDSSTITNTLEGSTAPTTPDGSYMSSPILQPQSRPLAVLEALDTSITQTRPVRNICFVGAGYVGGPTAAVMAFHNPQILVTVVDLDGPRIRRWNSRHPPVHEPGLGDILRVARDGARETVIVDARATCSSSRDSEMDLVVPARRPNLFFSTQVGRSISEADVVLISVNTPTKARGAGKGRATDMTAFESVTAEIAQHARPGAIIVEKSTVPCRTAQMVKETMAAHRPGLHFEVLSNPEFLAAGTAVNDLLFPDRVLIGSSPTRAGRSAASALAAVYAAWVPRQRIMTTNLWSSELAKLVANSMLAQRISSINSIAAVCEQTGAHVDEVAAAVGADPRIGDKFLKAGIGFGGSCFKKDLLSLVYLAHGLGLDQVAEYWSQVQAMNEYSRDRFTARVVRCLNNTLAGKKLVVLGYAFKKNTNDTRESPALDIIRTLLDEGPRELAVFDPCCDPTTLRDEIKHLLKGCHHVDAHSVLKEDGGPLVVYESVYQACAAADAVLITTEFDEFRNRRPNVICPTSDPRPLALGTTGQGPSELELLSLSRHMRKSPTRTPLSSSSRSDPLQRLYPEPACGTDCPDCKSENNGHAPIEGYTPKETVDWAKISYYMKRPRWVFDGRGVLDVEEMERLGFQVSSVGRVMNNPQVLEPSSGGLPLKIS